MKKLLTAVSFTLSLGLSFNANSADVISLDSSNPDSEDIIQGFLGNQSSDTGNGMKFRGIRMKNSEGSSTCNVSNQAVALQIPFAFNSATLEQRGINTVTEMAKAMNSASLANCKFIVEGHTDAAGKSGYNQALSEKRANAVAKLLRSANVTADRLESVGKGEESPINAENPFAAENRRVQFKVVTK